VKALRFVPLAFLAGIDGFDLFAPYLAIVLATTPLIRLIIRRRALRLQAVAVSRGLESPAEELSAAL
jgi:hypothetical protein